MDIRKSTKKYLPWAIACLGVGFAVGLYLDRNNGQTLIKLSGPAKDTLFEKKNAIPVDLPDGKEIWIVTMDFMKDLRDEFLKESRDIPQEVE